MYKNNIKSQTNEEISFLVSIAIKKIKTFI